MRCPAVALALAALVVAATAGCSISTGEYPGTVEVGDLSQATKLQMIRDQLAAEADAFGILEPPIVDIVRIVPLNEWAQTIVDCMVEAGFPAVLTDDGEGVSYSGVAPELAQQLDLAQYVCDAKYPVDPANSIPLNDSQLQFLYWYFTGELTECLIDEGYEVERAPSYAVFSEGYNDPSSTWSPYASIISSQVSADELNRLFGVCQQLPDSSELWPR